MVKPYLTYNFKGNTGDIVNSVLSLLFGKDFYQEPSVYGSFVNESHPENYRKKIKAILDLMQRENLILIRENHEEGGMQIATTLNGNQPNTMPSPFSIIYIRQHGKDVLIAGGFNISNKRIADDKDLKINIPLVSKLLLIIMLIAASGFII